MLGPPQRTFKFHTHTNKELTYNLLALRQPALTMCHQVTSGEIWKHIKTVEVKGGKNQTSTER